MSRHGRCIILTAWRAALLAAVICLTAAGSSAAQTLKGAAQEGDSHAGQRYAEKHCATCHDVTQTSTDPKPAASLIKIANTPGMTAIALRVWFQSPHQNMPNLVLPADQQRDLIAYILSLKETKK